MVKKIFNLIFILVLGSCSSSSLRISKTSNDFSQKKIISENLYEYGPYTFLRSEYAQNYLLVESDINKISSEMINSRLFFADVTKNIQKGQLIAQAGTEIEVVGKVSIDKVGEFYKISTPKGVYLVKDSDTTPLKTKEEYLGSVTAAISLASHNTVENQKDLNFEISKIDYFNHVSEEERIRKIIYFCEKYPQYKKFEDLVKNKKITIGMSEHLLGLSWGRPSQVKEEEIKSVLFRSFIYEDKYQIITKNSVIRSWRKL